MRIERGKVTDKGHDIVDSRDREIDTIEQAIFAALPGDKADLIC